MKSKPFSFHFIFKTEEKELQGRVQLEPRGYVQWGLGRVGSAVSPQAMI